MNNVIDYIIKARPDNEGLPVKMFNEDWDPVGPELLSKMIEKGYAYVRDEMVHLTPHTFIETTSKTTVRAVLAHKNKLPKVRVVKALKPPEKCDICSQSLKGFDYFYDFAIPTVNNRWGWGCRKCFQETRGKLGVGCGQEYDSKSDVQTRGGRYTS